MWLKLGRDRETGKSKGFAFLKYEDQRSTDLAVDNLSGAEVLGRKINVDHKVFKDGEVPEEDDEEGMNLLAALYKEDEVGAAEDGKAVEDRPQRPLLKEESELQELIQMDDDDPMKASMVERKQEEVRKAAKRWEKENSKHGERRHKHHHRHHGRSKRLENGHARHQRASPSPEGSNEETSHFRRDRNRPWHERSHTKSRRRRESGSRSDDQRRTHQSRTHHSRNS